MRDESKVTSDITVYGATGFVGKYICQYLLASAAVKGQPLRIVLGGRNKEKLEQRVSSLDVGSCKLEVYVADSSDLPGLTKMAEATKVVIACAGPFAKYGTNVVAACAKTGADYVDITGEIHWVALMRQRFGEDAKVSGARIISLCGYDSIPSDISVLIAVNALREAIGSSVEIETGKVWYYANGGANAGTVHTMLSIPMDIQKNLFEANGSLRKVPFFMADPLCLTHPTDVRYNPGFLERKNALAATEWWNQVPSFDGVLGGGMSLGFMMAVANAKVVYSTAISLDYGPNFKYYERWALLGFRMTRTLGVLSAIPSLFFLYAMGIFMCILKLPFFGQKLFDIVYPPGMGPPHMLNEMCNNEVYAEVAAKAASPSNDSNVDRAACHIYFEGDAGNMVTAQCVCESALSLLYDRSELPERTKDGFGTPAELLGKVLVKRLQENQVRKVIIETAVQKDSPKVNLKLLA